MLLKTSGDPLRVSTRATASATLIVTPPAGIAWLLTGRPGLPAEAWLLVTLSGLAELGYFIFLSSAYKRGDLSAVYPLARGTAPLLAVAAGFILLGERLSHLEILGIALLLAGIWTAQRPATTREGILPALLTGVFIAAYSTIDRVGVRLVPPWLYAWVLWAITAGLLLLWQAILRYRSGPGRRRGEEPSWRSATTVGLLMATTYLMVLVALSMAPLSVVAPARESAIVLVTGWGVWRLREQQGAWLKVIAALVIVAGIVLVALT